MNSASDLYTWLDSFCLTRIWPLELILSSSLQTFCISCNLNEYINYTWSLVTWFDYKMVVGFSCRFLNGICCSCVTFRTTYTVDCAVTKLCIDPFTYLGVKYLITTFTMVHVETRDSVFTICLNHVLRSWPIQMWPSHNWERIESGVVIASVSWRQCSHFETVRNFNNKNAAKKIPVTEGITSRLLAAF